MEIQGQTDVSKVSSEPHKHKSPAFRHVSCPTSQKAGQDEKGVLLEPQRPLTRERGLPEVGDPPS